MNAHPFITALGSTDLVQPYGLIRKVASSHMESSGPMATVGDLCEVEDGHTVLAEVASVDEAGLVLVPVRQSRPVRPGARVSVLREGGVTPVGPAFAGRAVDALGLPIDGGGAVDAASMAPLSGTVPAPLDRGASGRKVVTGIRAIDGLLTLAEGQRIGIFAASGVGKTSLIEQLAAQVRSDRCILCLVGERGREVEGIWRALSERDDSTRFTMVAATSDETAALRARSVSAALCLAEYWRDRGEHVLLIIDSVTRLAMALREIGLAAGEPPTVRAYTPNVFASLPRVVERCGAMRNGGSITAIMTVLSETDEVDDPIVEVMKSLLDGHIILSRTLAEQGHFPAIDISRSISRQASRLVDARQAASARAAVALLGTYEEARVMIESGVYRSGSSAAIDRAIAGRDKLLSFLRQGQGDNVAFEAMLAGLHASVPAGVGNA